LTGLIFVFSLFEAALAVSEKTKSTAFRARVTVGFGVFAFPVHRQ